LKNQSKEESIPFQLVVQLFAQEEFLRKLSLSKYVDNLILKGGMFIYTLTEFDSRPTRDIDFLIKHLCGSLENIKLAMEDICSISTGNVRDRCGCKKVFEGKLDETRLIYY